MTRMITALFFVFLTVDCAETCLSCCYADSDCPTPERCDVDNAICVSACEADDDCTETQRCDATRGHCVFEEPE